MSGRPVVFVHGLWLHSTSWEPWFDRFRAAGYDPVAPEWPGIPDSVAAARADPGRYGAHGVSDVVQHLAGIIGELPDPVLIGHSFGGLMVQILLGRGLGRAAIALDPAPMRGVLALPPSLVKVASVALRNPANRSRAVALTPAQFRYGFGNALPADESDALYDRWSIPTPGRPLFDAALANLGRGRATTVDTGNPARGPLLVTAGGRDHAVPPAISRATVRMYRRSPAVTDLVELPDRGHSLIIDHGLSEVVDLCLAWLGAHDL
jgi:non-heme chloroperoxidase